MNARLVTGTVHQSDGSTAWASGPVFITPLFGGYVVGVVTNASGAFTVEVPTISDGNGSYYVHLPNGSGFVFTMPAGTTTYDISTLITGYEAVALKPLSITPDADVVPLTVNGKASQTANLANFKSSAGTVLADVRYDGVIEATAGLTTKVKAGTPSDADFTSAPASGTVVIDTSASKIWVRVGSTWKFVAVA